MRIATRGIAVLLTTAMLATTAMVPAASAGDRRHYNHRSHGGHSHGKSDNGNAALAIGLGIAAIAGIALLANQSQASQPAYYPPPPTYYPPAPTTYYQPAPTSIYQPNGYPQPVYTQPHQVYAPQAYGSPTCTTINELPACMDQYGNWQYIR